MHPHFSQFNCISRDNTFLPDTRHCSTSEKKFIDIVLRDARDIARGQIYSWRRSNERKTSECPSDSNFLGGRKSHSGTLAAHRGLRRNGSDIADARSRKQGRGEAETDGENWQRLSLYARYRRRFASRSFFFFLAHWRFVWNFTARGRSVYGFEKQLRSSWKSRRSGWNKDFLGKVIVFSCVPNWSGCIRYFYATRITRREKYCNEILINSLSFKQTTYAYLSRMNNKVSNLSFMIYFYNISICHRRLLKCKILWITSETTYYANINQL